MPKVLVSGAADMIAKISSDGVAGFADVGQALDVAMEKIAGALVLMAQHRS